MRSKGVLEAGQQDLVGCDTFVTVVTGHGSSPRGHTKQILTVPVSFTTYSKVKAECMIGQARSPDWALAVGIGQAASLD